MWFQFAAEKVLSSKENLETGTDETIRIMPCVMMYQSKEASRLEETTPRRIFFKVTGMYVLNELLLYLCLIGYSSAHRLTCRRACSR